MPSLNRFAWNVLLAVSHLLDLLMFGLERVDRYLRAQLDGFGVRPGWQPAIITTGWVVLLLLVLRALDGWPRIVAIALTALVLAKLYGLLPR